MIFSFGQTEHERLEVDILRYERATLGEYWDDNWVVAKLEVAAGKFRGRADATFQTAEIEAFTFQLRMMYSTLKGEAEFSTLEGQLTLKLSADGRGHVTLEGALLDKPGIGNRLNFTFALDQSEIGVSLQQLESVLAAFPVRK